MDKLEVHRELNIFLKKQQDDIGVLFYKRDVTRNPKGNMNEHAYKGERQMVTGITTGVTKK